MKLETETNVGLVRFFNADMSITPSSEVLGVNAEAEVKAIALLTRSRMAVAVTTPAEQGWAVEASRDIRTHVKQVRALSLDYRRPLNEVAKRIKEVEDGYCAPLEAEQRRVERLVVDFQLKEQRRVEAEERIRQAEIARLEAARLEAEEKARKAAERMSTDAGLAQAVKAEEKAAAVEQKLQDAIRAPLPEVAKASGVAMKRVLRYEVTDINALVKARPDLCKIEPKPSAIQAVCVPEIPVPGLKLWWEMTANTRTR